MFITAVCVLFLFQLSQFWSKRRALPGGPYIILLRTFNVSSVFKKDDATVKNLQTCFCTFLYGYEKVIYVQLSPLTTFDHTSH